MTRTPCRVRLVYEVSPGLLASQWARLVLTCHPQRHQHRDGASPLQQCRVHGATGGG